MRGSDTIQIQVSTSPLVEKVGVVKNRIYPIVGVKNASYILIAIFLIVKTSEFDVFAV